MRLYIFSLITWLICVNFLLAGNALNKKYRYWICK